MSQCHRRLGKHSHLRNFCGEEGALIGIANSSAQRLCIASWGNRPTNNSPSDDRRVLVYLLLGKCYIYTASTLSIGPSLCGYAYYSKRPVGSLIEGFKEHGVGVGSLYYIAIFEF